MVFLVHLRFLKFALPGSPFRKFAITLFSCLNIVIFISFQSLRIQNFKSFLSKSAKFRKHFYLYTT